MLTMVVAGRGGGHGAQCPIAHRPPPIRTGGVDTERRLQAGECARDPGCTYRPMAPRTGQPEDGAMTSSLRAAQESSPVGPTRTVGHYHTAPVIVAALDGSAASRSTTALAAGLIRKMGWRLALVPVPLTATAAVR